MVTFNEKRVNDFAQVRSVLKDTQGGKSHANSKHLICDFNLAMAPNQRQQRFLYWIPEHIKGKWDFGNY